MENSSKSAYERLVDEIRLSHPENITELEAHKLARKLMGFCKKLIEINSNIDDKDSTIVAFQRVNGNVDANQ